MVRPLVFSVDIPKENLSLHKGLFGNSLVIPRDNVHYK
jgi:hypothetical protein